jgi:hypothetical protein
MEKHSFNGPDGVRPSHASAAAHIVGWVFLGVAFAVAFALVFGMAVQLLWNWLMPVIFGLGEISYWQAFGLVILSKLLFGAFGHRHGDHYNRLHKKFSHRGKDFRADRKEDEMFEGWKHYKIYWQDEGKAAFEDYLRRRKDQEQKKSAD